MKNAKLSIFILLLICVTGGFIFAADEAPTPQQIAEVCKQPDAIFNEFMNQSMEIRVRYWFREMFYAETDRRKLAELAEQAIQKLKDVYNRLRVLINAVERYPGEDWDQRYGETGLWRQLARASENTIWLMKRAAVHSALATETFTPRERTEFLRKYSYLLGQSDDSDLNSYFKNRFLKLEMENILSRVTIRQISHDIRLGKANDDLELSLHIALIGARLGTTEHLTWVVDTWPQVLDFLSSVLLLDFNYILDTTVKPADHFALRDPIEAQLAAYRALHDNPVKHRLLLRELLSIDKFQLPVVHFALAESLHTQSPLEALEHYMEAAVRSQEATRKMPGMDTEYLSNFVAEYAYRLFAQDLQYCQATEISMRQWYAIFGNTPPSMIHYKYADLLVTCGDRKEGMIRLRELAEGNGPPARHAELDLIIYGMEETSPNTQAWNQLMVRLKTFLNQSEGTAEDLLTRQALELYCLQLLETGKDAPVEEVLRILSENQLTDEATRRLHIRALRRVGDYSQAFHLLDTAIQESQQCAIAEETLYALSDAAARFEYYIESQQLTVEQAVQMAEYAIGCVRVNLRPQAKLLWTEAILLQPDPAPSQLETVSDSLVEMSEQGYADTIDWIRSRARLHEVNHEYVAAARMWNRIAEIRGGQSVARNRSWQWWRAKYYEVRATSRRPGMQKAEIVRAIDVLRKTYAGIDDFWAEKFNELKRQRIGRD